MTTIVPESAFRGVRLQGLREVPMRQMSWDDPPPPACWVYEVWDTQHRLVYVGIADNFERRWAQHVAKSWWLGEVEVWYVDLCGYRSRGDARQVEAGMINDQHAVYNTNLEAPAYRAYCRMWADEDRLMDPFDCTPVAKRRFIGTPRG